MTKALFKAKFTLVGMTAGIQEPVPGADPSMLGRLSFLIRENSSDEAIWAVWALGGNLT